MVGESVDGGTTLLILFVPIIVSFNRIKAFALGVRFGAGFHSNYKSMLDNYQSQITARSSTSINSRQFGGILPAIPSFPYAF
jgi:hypothetical protein